ncbi:hypothetical protein PV325_001567 [Microctonus aethiopoides]|nr:hypothetical protein PV325_001567 [Microctonus aethiopoides]
MFPMVLMNVTELISWGNAISNVAVSNKEKKTIHISIQTFSGIFEETEALWNKFNDYYDKLSQKYYVRSKQEIYEDHDSKFLKNDKSTLNDYTLSVDRFYNDAYNLIKLGGQYDKIQFMNFQSSEFFDKRSLSITLEKIYQLIIPPNQLIRQGFIQLFIMNAKQNVQFECDKYISAQQYMFFFYGSLIITEIKGLIILTFAHSILQNLRGHTMVSPYNSKLALKEFEERVMDYHYHMNEAMASLPTVIYRCEAHSPVRGKDFIEFVNYRRAILLSSSIILPPHIKYNGKYHIKKVTTCDEINSSSINQPHLKGLQISNCKTLGSGANVGICHAKPNSSRKYQWFKVWSQIYGRNEECSTSIQTGSGDLDTINNHFCLCYATDNNLHRFNNSILRISMASQKSDIHNNMFVVGVKFVVYEGGIHLQIQQSKFIRGELNSNATVWKKLDDFAQDTKRKLLYSTLSDFLGQLYLDDVMLPPKYLVTGVRFLSRSTSPAGYYLQVHGTPYDLQTGKLNPEDSMWFIGGDWKYSKRLDYERDRIEIKILNHDDPVRCNGYNYDQTTNKFIQFQHSSVIKDAGQSTIPYIDAQPVEIYPPFPLSGIGLFYREKADCGGYIAPRIFAMDITQ